MTLVTKYMPKSTAEIVGQDKALGELKSFLANWKPGKAALLYGPPGSGKTSAIYALAAELGKDIFEVNASDSRNKAAVEETITAATKQESLLSFGKGKIVLLDEVDGLSGTKDRGATTSLKKVIEESRYPIIMTANDAYHKKLKDLRKKSVMIELAPLDHEAIAKRLKYICDKEKITYEEDVLRDLARRVGGDLRAAITDLEILSSEGKIENLDMMGDRHKTEDIEKALFIVMKTLDADIARNAFNDVNEDIPTQLLWLEENLPKEYEGEDLANAFEALSRADVHLGRIRRWQHWRFLVYASSQVSAGVALAKKEKYKKMIEYKRSGRILKLWMAKMKYMKREEIARKIGEKTHTSTKRARNDILPYVKRMVQLGNLKLQKEFDLTNEEVMWLKQ